MSLSSLVMASRTAGQRAVRAWRLRQCPKVSQDSLAKELGLDGSYVRHFEAGRKMLPLEARIALHKRTDVPLSMLLSSVERSLVAVATEPAATTEDAPPLPAAPEAEHAA